VTFFSPGKADLSGFKGNCSFEMIEEFHLYYFAKKLGKVDNETLSRGHLVRGIRVIDLQGLGISAYSKENIKYLNAVIGPVQKHFPEYMYKCFIINAPAFLKTVWGIIDPILEERTREKIIILDSEYMETISEYVDPAQWPEELGGGNPTPLYENLEEKHQSQVILPRSCFVQSINIENGAKVFYDFRTIDKDIGFQVDFEDSSGNIDTIIPYDRLESFKQIQSGTVTPTQVKGVFHFRFDNSFSLISSKTLVFSLHQID
jgi:hypothetical protein